MNKSPQMLKRRRKQLCQHGVRVMKTPGKKNAQVRLLTYASWLWRIIKMT